VRRCKCLALSGERQAATGLPCFFIFHTLFFIFLGDIRRHQATLGGRFSAFARLPPSSRLWRRRRRAKAAFSPSILLSRPGCKMSKNGAPERRNNATLPLYDGNASKKVTNIFHSTPSFAETGAFCEGRDLQVADYQ